MPYEIEYDATNDCMMCRMTGKVDLHLAQAFAVELIAQMTEHNCCCLLNDFREAEIAFSTLDLYEAPKLLLQAGVGLTIKRALVFKEASEDFAFFETVSVNQGQFVRTFRDFDEALAWIATGKR